MSHESSAGHPFEYLGASTWGFFRHGEPASWPSLEDAVKRIASLGLGVEVWERRTRHESFPGEVEIERLAEACGPAPFVTIHACRILRGWNAVGAREDLAFATRIGASGMIVHPASLGLSSPDDRPDLPDLRRWLEQAGTRGVRVLLENTVDSIWALDWFLDEIGSDDHETNLGLCIDIGHAHLSHDAGRHPVANYLERYQGIIRHLHIHDTAGTDDTHDVPGQGTIDFLEMARVLAETSFDGQAVIEIQSPRGIDQGLDEAIRFLQGLHVPSLDDASDGT